MDLLQIVGFEARAGYSGAAALTEAERFHPSVCILDLNMPGMDGDGLAVKLRERPGEPPAAMVAVTARSDDHARRRIRNAGFDMHFVKPVDPHQLVLVVDTLCRAWFRWMCNSRSTDVAAAS